MGTFLDQLKFTQSDNGREFRILDTFRYEIGVPGSNDIIEVPSDFVCDLASIPRLLWNIYPPFGKYTKAAIVHDWLYRTQIRTRKEADLIFLAAMYDCGVDAATRTIFYRAVRMFGWMRWGAAKKQLQNQ